MLYLAHCIASKSVLETNVEFTSAFENELNGMCARGEGNVSMGASDEVLKMNENDDASLKALVVNFWGLWSILFIRRGLICKSTNQQHVH